MARKSQKEREDKDGWQVSLLPPILIMSRLLTLFAFHTHHQLNFVSLLHSVLIISHLLILSCHSSLSCLTSWHSFFIHTSSITLCLSLALCPHHLSPLDSLLPFVLIISRLLTLFCHPHFIYHPLSLSCSLSSSSLTSWFSLAIRPYHISTPDSLLSATLHLSPSVSLSLSLLLFVLIISHLLILSCHSSLSYVDSWLSFVIHTSSITLCLSLSLALCPHHLSPLDSLLPFVLIISRLLTLFCHPHFIYHPLSLSLALCPHHLSPLDSLLPFVLIISRLLTLFCHPHFIYHPLSLSLALCPHHLSPLDSLLPFVLIISRLLTLLCHPHFIYHPLSLSLALCPHHLSPLDSLLPFVLIISRLLTLFCHPHFIYHPLSLSLSCSLSSSSLTSWFSLAIRPYLISTPDSLLSSTLHLSPSVSLLLFVLIISHLLILSCHSSLSYLVFWLSFVIHTSSITLCLSLALCPHHLSPLDSLLPFILIISRLLTLFCHPHFIYHPLSLSCSLSSSSLTSWFSLAIRPYHISTPDSLLSSTLHLSPSVSLSCSLSSSSLTSWFSLAIRPYHISTPDSLLSSTLHLSPSVSLSLSCSLSSSSLTSWFSLTIRPYHISTPDSLLSSTLHLSPSVSLLLFVLIISHLLILSCRSSLSYLDSWLSFVIHTSSITLCLSLALCPHHLSPLDSLLPFVLIISRLLTLFCHPHFFYHPLSLSLSCSLSSSSLTSWFSLAIRPYHISTPDSLLSSTLHLSPSVSLSLLLFVLIISHLLILSCHSSLSYLDSWLSFVIHTSSITLCLSLSLALCPHHLSPLDSLLPFVLILSRLLTLFCHPHFIYHPLSLSLSCSLSSSSLTSWFSLAIRPYHISTPDSLLSSTLHLSPSVSLLLFVLIISHLLILSCHSSLSYLDSWLSFVIHTSSITLCLSLALCPHHLSPLDSLLPFVLIISRLLTLFCHPHFIYHPLSLSCSLSSSSLTSWFSLAIRPYHISTPDSLLSSTLHLSPSVSLLLFALIISHLLILSCHSSLSYLDSWLSFVIHTSSITLCLSLALCPHHLSPLDSLLPFVLIISRLLTLFCHPHFIYHPLSLSCSLSSSSLTSWFSLAIRPYHISTPDSLLSSTLHLSPSVSLLLFVLIISHLLILSCHSSLSYLDSWLSFVIHTSSITLCLSLALCPHHLSPLDSLLPFVLIISRLLTLFFHPHFIYHPLSLSLSCSLSSSSLTSWFSLAIRPYHISTPDSLLSSTLHLSPSVSLLLFVLIISHLLILSCHSSLSYLDSWLSFVIHTSSITLCLSLALCPHHLSPLDSLLPFVLIISRLLTLFCHPHFIYHPLSLSCSLSSSSLTSWFSLAIRPYHISTPDSLLSSTLHLSPSVSLLLFVLIISHLLILSCHSSLSYLDSWHSFVIHTSSITLCLSLSLALCPHHLSPLDSLLPFVLIISRLLTLFCHPHFIYHPLSLSLSCSLSSSSLTSWFSLAIRPYLISTPDSLLSSTLHLSPSVSLSLSCSLSSSSLTSWFSLAIRPYHISTPDSLLSSTLHLSPSVSLLLFVLIISHLLILSCHSSLSYLDSWLSFVIHTSSITLCLSLALCPHHLSPLDSLLPFVLIISRLLTLFCHPHFIYHPLSLSCSLSSSSLTSWFSLAIRPYHISTPDSLLSSTLHLSPSVSLLLFVLIISHLLILSCRSSLSYLDSWLSFVIHTSSITLCLSLALCPHHLSPLDSLLPFVLIISRLLTLFCHPHFIYHPLSLSLSCSLSSSSLTSWFSLDISSLSYLDSWLSFVIHTSSITLCLSLALCPHHLSPLDSLLPFVLIISRLLTLFCHPHFIYHPLSLSCSLSSSSLTSWFSLAIRPYHISTPDSLLSSTLHLSPSVSLLLFVLIISHLLILSCHSSLSYLDSWLSFVIHTSSITLCLSLALCPHHLSPLDSLLPFVLIISRLLTLFCHPHFIYHPLSLSLSCSLSSSSLTSWFSLAIRPYHISTPDSLLSSTLHLSPSVSLLLFVLIISHLLILSCHSSLSYLDSWLSFVIHTSSITLCLSLLLFVLIISHLLILSCHSSLSYLDSWLSFVIHTSSITLCLSLSLALCPHHLSPLDSLLPFVLIISRLLTLFCHPHFIYHPLSLSWSLSSSSHTSWFSLADRPYHISTPDSLLSSTLHLSPSVSLLLFVLIISHLLILSCHSSLSYLDSWLSFVIHTSSITLCFSLALCPHHLSPLDSLLPFVLIISRLLTLFCHPHFIYHPLSLSLSCSLSSSSLTSWFSLAIRPYHISTPDSLLSSTLHLSPSVSLSLLLFVLIISHLLILSCHSSLSYLDSWLSFVIHTSSITLCLSLALCPHHLTPLDSLLPIVLIISRLLTLFCHPHFIYHPLSLSCSLSSSSLTSWFSLAIRPYHISTPDSLLSSTLHLSPSVSLSLLLFVLIISHLLILSCHSSLSYLDSWLSFVIHTSSITLCLSLALCPHHLSPLDSLLPFVLIISRLLTLFCHPHFIYHPLSLSCSLSSSSLTSWFSLAIRPYHISTPDSLLSSTLHLSPSVSLLLFVLIISHLLILSCHSSLSYVDSWLSFVIHTSSITLCLSLALCPHHLSPLDSLLPFVLIISRLLTLFCHPHFIYHPLSLSCSLSSSSLTSWFSLAIRPYHISTPDSLLSSTLHLSPSVSLLLFVLIISHLLILSCHSSLSYLDSWLSFVIYTSSLTLCLCLSLLLFVLIISHLLILSCHSSLSYLDSWLSFVIHTSSITLCLSLALCPHHLSPLDSLLPFVLIISRLLTLFCHPHFIYHPLSLSCSLSSSSLTSWFSLAIRPYHMSTPDSLLSSTLHLLPSVSLLLFVLIISHLLILSCHSSLSYLDSWLSFVIHTSSITLCLSLALCPHHLSPLDSLLPFVLIISRLLTLFCHPHFIYHPLSLSCSLSSSSLTSWFSLAIRPYHISTPDSLLSFTLHLSPSVSLLLFVLIISHLLILSCHSSLSYLDSWLSFVIYTSSLTLCLCLSLLLFVLIISHLLILSCHSSLSYLDSWLSFVIHTSSITLCLSLLLFVLIISHLLILSCHSSLSYLDSWLSFVIHTSSITLCLSLALCPHHLSPLDSLFPFVLIVSRLLTQFCTVHWLSKTLCLSLAIRPYRVSRVDCLLPSTLICQTLFLSYPLSLSCPYQ